MRPRRRSRDLADDRVRRRCRPEQLDPFRSVIARHCTHDGWSADMQQCLLATKTIAEGNACEKLLSPAAGAGARERRRGGGAGRRGPRVGAVVQLDPSVRFPPELPITARVDRHRERDRRAPGRDRRGRDRLGQDDAAAEDLPRDGPRARTAQIGCTQPRRIAATSVAARVAQELDTRARRRRRLPDPLRRQGQAHARTIKFMTDGILLAEIQGDPLLRALRHDHHRRGARAQPQHRLPARLPEAPPAAAAGPARHRQLGDARDRAVLRVLRRRAGDRGLGPHLSRSTCSTGRRATTRRTSPTRSPTRSTRSPSSIRAATSSCSCRASARSARRWTSSSSARCRTPSCCRSTRGCRRPSSSASSSACRSGASCSRPTSPRPRSRSPGIVYVVDTGRRARQPLQRRAPA